MPSPMQLRESQTWTKMSLALWQACSVAVKVHSKKNTFISTCPALYSTLPYCFSIVFGLCVMEFQQFKLCPPFLVILEISFDPMKVVSDAVEEITDRRNMFLSYLSGVLMQDKGDRYWCLKIQLIYGYCFQVQSTSNLLTWSASLISGEG